LGESYAGAGSKADDASIEFDNPAGMVRIKKQELAVSTVAVNAHSTFKATSATNRWGDDVLNTATKTTSHPLTTNYLPAIHYVLPLNQQWYFGFGVTVPFGLETNYAKDSAARYFGTDSKIETVNINPSLAYAFNDHFSFGLGLSAQYIHADLDQMVDAASLAPSKPSTATNMDAEIDNEAHDWGFGWNAGILYQFTPNTRVGLTYRSKIHHNAKGKSKVTIPDSYDEMDKEVLENTYGLKDGDVSTKLDLPETIVLSGYHDINQAWAMMASATYTRWRRFKDLTMEFTSGLSDATIHENFHDTMKYAIGTDYRPNSRTILRAGLAYDQSPTCNKYRTIPLPDASRQWASLGLKYMFTKTFAIDLGYAYVHINRGSVDQTSSGNTITGNYRHSYANLFGAQLNWVLG